MAGIFVMWFYFTYIRYSPGYSVTVKFSKIALSRCRLPPSALSAIHLQLNEQYDPNDTKNIVRLLDCFQYQNHLCLVFELLSINLYELLKQNQFRGLPLSLIRQFIKQILEVGFCCSAYYFGFILINCCTRSLSCVVRSLDLLVWYS